MTQPLLYIDSPDRLRVLQLAVKRLERLAAAFAEDNDRLREQNRLLTALLGDA